MSPAGRHWWPEPSALRSEGEVTQEPGLVMVTQSRGTKGIKNTHKREERARSGAQREEEGHEVSLGRGPRKAKHGQRRPGGTEAPGTGLLRLPLRSPGHPLHVHTHHLDGEERNGPEEVADRVT